MKRIAKIALGFLSVLAANAQTLDSYIQEAENNNPEVQAFEIKYNIATEKVAEVDALPNGHAPMEARVEEPPSAEQEPA